MKRDHHKKLYCRLARAVNRIWRAGRLLDGDAVRVRWVNWARGLPLSTPQFIVMDPMQECLCARCSSKIHRPATSTCCQAAPMMFCHWCHKSWLDSNDNFQVVCPDCLELRPSFAGE